jgi:hypothetical protein
MAGGDELVGRFPVAREALHLEERSLVPVEAQPSHAFEDRLHRLRRGALQISVLDAQDELAAVAARVRPREERGARAAYVQVAGGAGRKTGSDLHRVLGFSHGPSPSAEQHAGIFAAGL